MDKLYWYEEQRKLGFVLCKKHAETVSKNQTFRLTEIPPTMGKPCIICQYEWVFNRFWDTGGFIRERPSLKFTSNCQCGSNLYLKQNSIYAVCLVCNAVFTKEELGLKYICCPKCRIPRNLTVNTNTIHCGSCHYEGKITPDCFFN